MLGPFGGAMLAALIPTIADDLGTTDGYVAASITAYMIPFATLQLVSGTLAERHGGARVVRLGYAGFCATAVLCTFAPDVWTFIGARAAMGAANAFLSPILLAALSEAVQPEKLGRAVGTFAAFQVAGLTLAPVLGGALGLLNWRLAFALVAVVAFALAVPRIDLRPSGRNRPAASLRSLLDRRIGLISATGFAGYLGFTAIGFVIVLLCSREFGLSSATSGLVIASYGVGGIVFGRLGGLAADRAGRPLTAFTGGLVCAAGVLALVFVPSAWAVGLVYFGVGCGAAFAWAGVNTIAVESFPDNRAGAVSAYSAFKFVGVALAPLLYVPLFDLGERLPFVLATGFSVLFALLVLPWFGSYRKAS